MAEWLVEDGIGEQRALLAENGQALAARVLWPGELAPGLVEDAMLVTRDGARGTVRFASGEEALVRGLPRAASEGVRVRALVTRSAMRESGRVKPAQARACDLACRPALSLAEMPGARIVHRFPAGTWDEVMGDAFARTIAFPGGALHFSPTPAMTLVDVDGAPGGPALALAACTPLARALGRMGLGGAIGIDFPTLATKAERRAVDDALGEALAGALGDFEHERTAMNGFGFVQLVARATLPSLLHRCTHQRAAAAARLLLRRAENLQGAGTIELAAHPGVLDALDADWLGELGRRTGRAVTTRAQPALAIEAPHAQLVQR